MREERDEPLAHFVEYPVREPWVFPEPARDEDGHEVERVRSHDPLSEGGGNGVGIGGHECEWRGACEQRCVVGRVDHRQVLLFNVNVSPCLANGIDAGLAGAGIAVFRIEE